MNYLYAICVLLFQYNFGILFSGILEDKQIISNSPFSTYIEPSKGISKDLISNIKYLGSSLYDNLPVVLVDSNIVKLNIENLQYLNISIEEYDDSHLSISNNLNNKKITINKENTSLFDNLNIQNILYLGLNSTIKKHLICINDIVCVIDDLNEFFIKVNRENIDITTISEAIFNNKDDIFISIEKISDSNIEIEISYSFGIYKKKYILEKKEISYSDMFPKSLLRYQGTSKNKYPICKIHENIIDFQNGWVEYSINDPYTFKQYEFSEDSLNNLKNSLNKRISSSIYVLPLKDDSSDYIKLLVIGPLFCSVEELSINKNNKLIFSKETL